jgi:hypothetical protein
MFGGFSAGALHSLSENIVAQDGVSAAANFLHNPKNAALVAGGAAAIAGAQLVPGIGEAVDLAAGVAGVAMYTAAGPEHRTRITQAVGELRVASRSVCTLKARMLPSPDFTGETPGRISLLHTPVDATL